MMMCPNIFVDTSYAVYYTGFGAFSWYTEEFSPVIPEDGSFDPMNDPEFKAEYDKRFQYKLFDVASKNVNLVDRKRIFFCLDCRRDKIWRMSYFPEYKISRKTAKRTFSWKGIFDYTQNILLPNMCEKYGCKMINDDNSEGDDIIAICARSSDRHNLIIANDNDLLQLLNEKTLIVNMKNEPIDMKRMTERLNIEEAKELSPKDYLSMKVLMGDDGDEISGIFPRCGIKTAWKLINNKQLLKEKLQADNEAAKKLKRNMMLIDFNNIPTEIFSAVSEKFKLLENAQ